MKFDFSGWATKNDLKCSDGRTIRRNAFKDNDGSTVPLVWNHQHGEANNVLGHALLENRDEGVYAYCSFNDTDNAQNAKLMVQHGDITSLSIYANKLKQKGGDVIHGAIREVSLVLAGANPGACIDSVIMHGEEQEDTAIIYTDEELYLNHADEEVDAEESGEETVGDVFSTLSEKQKKAVYALIGMALKDKGGEAKHSAYDDEDEDLYHADDEDDEGDEETIGDVFNTLSEKQKKAVYALIGMAINDKNQNGSNRGETEEMKHNLFDNEYDNTEVLSHSDMEAIFSDAKRYGSLKDSVIAHGIEDIEYLFPEAHNLNTPPEFIKREDGWVSKVMNGVHHTPFARIKSMFADLTEDEARAKGYIKGKLKKDEVFGLLKRTTTPTTIYKKQKLDRDDVIDITDFDVVSWLKTEMRMMLNEEIARAILIGDGRSTSSDDKINEQNIRPIWTDDDLFSVKFDVTAGLTASETAKNFIRSCVRSRKQYKGSGNPTLYTTEDMLTECLLLEDVNGRIIYDSAEKLATAMRVKEIVTVPVMEAIAPRTDTTDASKHDLLGIIVNLSDYNVGADKGGAVNMFDDFDIDYNAQKYLIETRCSGALIKPYSAIVLETAHVG